MAHPSEYYIRYLLARAYGVGETETAESINFALEAFRLPRVDEDEFDVLEMTFDPPKNFQFYNPDHLPTVRFMKDEKIYNMWRPTVEEDAVLDLVDMPLPREKIQILLMNRVSSKEVADRVNKVYGSILHSRTIDMFRHYFWNVSRASIEEWDTILYRSKFRDHYIAALTGSRSQALYRAGFSPKIDGKQALKEAHRALAMRIEATRVMPDTRETTQMLTSMSKELVSVHHALFGEGAGVEEQINELSKKVRMQRDAPNVIPLRQLAPKGNHSGSGAKEGKKA